MSHWFHIEVERVLDIDRGVNTILCSRQLGPEIVVRMTDEAIEKLKRQFLSTNGNREAGA